MKDLIKKLLPYILGASIGSGITFSVGKYASVECKVSQVDVPALQEAN